MKTVIVLYLPGHAGNFIARLFSMTPDTMPLIRKDQLEQHLDQGTPLPEDFDRQTNYQFSSVNQEFGDWQQFHRAYADALEISQYRLLNIFCGYYYSRIVIPIHPTEFRDFSSPDPTEFYCVDLDLNQWGNWVASQKQKLGFYYRGDEHAHFEKQKTLYNMKSINLTKMLNSEQDFLEEYLVICKQMLIEPLPNKALWLRNDWYSVRVKEQCQCI
jgi:hypothetical protein